MWRADEHGAPNYWGLSTRKVGGMHKRVSMMVSLAKIAPQNLVGPCRLLMSMMPQTLGGIYPAKSGGMQHTDEHEAPNSRGLSTRKVWGHAAY